MDFRQIETQLRTLFADTHGDEFKKIGVLFAMLNGCQPAKLQRATGYEMPLIQAVLEDVGTHAPFAVYSGAMSPRHLWKEYPHAKTLIETITGQKLTKDVPPAPIRPEPQPAKEDTMSQPVTKTPADVCGVNECARPSGHDGRHRRASTKERVPYKSRYATDRPAARVSIARNKAPLTAIAPTAKEETPAPAPLPTAEIAPALTQPLAPAASTPAELPDVRVFGRFHFVFQPDDANAADDLRIEMSGRTSISRKQAFGWMGAIIDGE